MVDKIKMMNVLMYIISGVLIISSIIGTIVLYKYPAYLNVFIGIFIVSFWVPAIASLIIQYKYKVLKWRAT